MYNIKLGSNDSIQTSKLYNLNRRKGATSWSRSRKSHNWRRCSSCWASSWLCKWSACVASSFAISCLCFCQPVPRSSYGCFFYTLLDRVSIASPAKIASWRNTRKNYYLIGVYSNWGDFRVPFLLSSVNVVFYNDHDVMWWSRRRTLECRVKRRGLLWGVHHWWYQGGAQDPEVQSPSFPSSSSLSTPSASVFLPRPIFPLPALTWNPSLALLP